MRECGGKGKGLSGKKEVQAGKLLAGTERLSCKNVRPDSVMNGKSGVRRGGTQIVGRGNISGDRRGDHAREELR